MERCGRGRWSSGRNARSRCFVPRDKGLTWKRKPRETCTKEEGDRLRGTETYVKVKNKWEIFLKERRDTAEEMGDGVRGLRCSWQSLSGSDYLTVVFDVSMVYFRREINWRLKQYQYWQLWTIAMNRRELKFKEPFYLYTTTFLNFKHPYCVLCLISSQ